MADLTAPAPSTGSDTATRAACLQRLATALCGYADLAVTVRADGPAPCLAVRNTAIPDLSETITISASGANVTYAWSWGERIADASRPDHAALAIAYVLSARNANIPRATR